MAVRFGTADWARALVDGINGSSEYRNAAAKWGVGFDGDLLFVFEPDDRLERPVYLSIRLSGGTCGGAEFVAGEDAAGAGFVLRAPFTLWREILDRKTLAATAILKGRMKVGGDRMTLLRHAGANRALIHCAASVDTDWG
jgi:putative sterol carrier protein